MKSFDQYEEDNDVQSNSQHETQEKLINEHKFAAHFSDDMVSQSIRSTCNPGNWSGTMYDFV